MNLSAAIAPAAEAHRGQFDKGGAPYFAHAARERKYRKALKRLEAADADQP